MLAIFPVVFVSGVSYMQHSMAVSSLWTGIHDGTLIVSSRPSQTGQLTSVGVQNSDMVP